MMFYIFIALLNGAFVGTSRTINGQLSTVLGPFRASFWNHFVGFLFLTLILFIQKGWRPDSLWQLPFPLYLGGFFGSLFVAVNSYVFPRMGAMTATLLVISGQMTSAVLIDWWSQGAGPSVIQCLGVILILFGMYLTRFSHTH